MDIRLDLLFQRSIPLFSELVVTTNHLILELILDEVPCFSLSMLIAIQNEALLEFANHFMHTK